MSTLAVKAEHGKKKNMERKKKRGRD